MTQGQRHPVVSLAMRELCTFPRVRVTLCEERKNGSHYAPMPPTQHKESVIVSVSVLASWRQLSVSRDTRSNGSLLLHLGDWHLFGRQRQRLSVDAQHAGHAGRVGHATLRTWSKALFGSHVRPCTHARGLCSGPRYPQGERILVGGVVSLGVGRTSSFCQGRTFSTSGTLGVSYAERLAARCETHTSCCNASSTTQASTSLETP